jgi:type II secretory pathway pseudopilin PulG
MEILIAIFILGIVMATVLGTFTGIIASSRVAEKRAELYQTGRAVMDLISADIRGMFNQPTGGNGSFFLGAIETIEGKSMSKMDFVTTNSLPVRLGKNPFLSERGYRVKKNPKGGMYSLWRRSQSPPQDPFQDGGKEVPVCRIVESFNLEFVLNNDKKENLSNSTPKAVIIDFTLNLDGEKESFVTMVRPMIAIGDQRIDDK